MTPCKGEPGTEPSTCVGPLSPLLWASVSSPGKLQEERATQDDSVYIIRHIAQGQVHPGLSRTG